MAPHRRGGGVRRTDLGGRRRAGSRIVAARLVRDLMRLCFLLEREYAPATRSGSEPPSRGSRLQRKSNPRLTRALAAESYTEREAGLVAAYEAVARRHNAVGLTVSVDPATARVPRTAVPGHRREPVRGRVPAGDRRRRIAGAAVDGSDRPMGRLDRSPVRRTPRTARRTEPRSLRQLSKEASPPLRAGRDRMHG